MAQFSQEADRTEFAWKELGNGIWLIDPELEMIRELLQMCPSLERMVFPKLYEQDVFPQLAPVVENSMPQLRHLDLTLIGDQPFQICHLVKTCKDLTTLHVGRLQCNSSPLVDSLLSGHGHSLQALHIRTFINLSSQQLNIILSNCRCLRSVYAMSEGHRPAWNTIEISPILNTKDLALVPEEPGWNCKDLETLQLCYNGLETSLGIPEVLGRQIAQLSKLKDLSLQRNGTSGGPPVQEKESVRLAVSSWIALSKLRRLELRGLNAFVDEALVVQVRKQWAQLELVRYSHD
ncbi:hypothetical protein BGZ72_009938 [Mortierella alpina]|nr:hypothetical protein BGZ72_009938 [Mortierella alpina]